MKILHLRLRYNLWMRAQQRIAKQWEQQTQPLTTVQEAIKRANNGYYNSNI